MSRVKTILWEDVETLPSYWLEMIEYRERVAGGVEPLEAWRQIQRAAVERRSAEHMARDVEANARPDSTPVVLVSTLDGWPVPRVKAIDTLDAAARAVAGWSCRRGYAMAWCPDRWYENGRLAKAAHLLESIGLYAQRDRSRLRAVWHSIDRGNWKFDHAWVDGEKIGIRSIVGRLSD